MRVTPGQVIVMAARWASPWVLAAVLAVLPGAVAADELAGAQRLAAEMRGWAALRAMDCGRCHGRDLDGWAAPSLLAAVRDGSRERFDRLVLEGDIVRGMPGYKSQPLVVAELDAIYAYLRARAAGQVFAGPSRSAP